MHYREVPGWRGMRGGEKEREGGGKVLCQDRRGHSLAPFSHRVLELFTEAQDLFCTRLLIDKKWISQRKQYLRLELI
jgi:hypothetical protein